MKRVALLALLAGGCSVVNDPSAHLPEPLPSDDLCATYAEVLCDGVLRCCGPASMTPREDCVSIVGRTCANTLAPILSDPRTGYDAEEAGYQLNYARTLADSCDPAIETWLNQSGGLLALLAGTVPEGELCNPTFAESFPEGRYDLPRFYSCEGDLACRPTTSIDEWRCLARGERGAVCVGLTDCVDGLTCRAADARSECSDRLPDGSECVADTQCESYRCGACTNPGTPTQRCVCQPNDTAEQVWCGALGI